MLEINARNSKYNKHESNKIKATTMRSILIWNPDKAQNFFRSFVELDVAKRRKILYILSFSLLQSTIS